MHSEFFVCYMQKEWEKQQRELIAQDEEIADLKEQLQNCDPTREDQLLDILREINLMTTDP